jgi:hypothetical protein
MNELGANEARTARKVLFVANHTRKNVANNTIVVKEGSQWYQKTNLRKERRSSLWFI